MSKENNTSVRSKLAELDELVRWFESDEFELEQAIERFEKAELLSKEIEKELSEFKHKVTVLSKNFSESV